MLFRHVRRQFRSLHHAIYMIHKYRKVQTRNCNTPYLVVISWKKSFVVQLYYEYFYKLYKNTVCKLAITKYLEEVKFRGYAWPIHLTRTKSTQTYTYTIFSPPCGASTPLRGFAITRRARARTNAHTHKHTHTFSLSLSLSVDRTPLEEWSVRRRDLYLTTHNTHMRKTSKPAAEFELQSQQASGRKPTP